MPPPKRRRKNQHFRLTTGNTSRGPQFFVYVVKSKGPATISEKSTPAGKELCVSYPVPKLGLLSAHPTETEPLTYKMIVGRNIFGQRIFSMSGGDQLFSEPCAGPSKSFHELNKLAAEVKACRAKGGGDCGGGASEIFRAINEFKNLP